MILLFDLLFGSVISIIAVGISSIFSRSRALFWLLVALMASAMAISLVLLYMEANISMYIIKISNFSLALIAAFSLFFVLSLLASYHFEKRNILLFLASLSYASVFLILSSEYFVTVLIGMELMSIASVLMLLLKGKHSVEAAVKLFILGAIAIAILAMALPLVFAYTNGSFLAPISNVPFSILLFSIVLIAAGFSVDAAQFPFNLWVPDVYEEAPSNITALISSINKGVAFAALILVMFTLFAAYAKSFMPVFSVLSILTMLFGNFVAMVQKSVKRMLAYSSISQAGYIMIGVAVATTYGIEASVFQIIAYGIAAIGSFAIVQALELRGMQTFDDYEGLANGSKFLAYALSIFMLSLAGFPLLMGFASKFMLFASAFDSNMLILAAFGVFNSFISIYYYGRLMGSVFSGRPKKRIFLDKATIAVVAICAALIIAFGIYPALPADMAYLAAATLQIK